MSLVALGPLEMRLLDGHLLNYQINEVVVCVAYLEQYSTTVGWDPSVDYEEHSAGHPSLIRKNRMYESISHIVMMSLTS